MRIQLNPLSAHGHAGRRSGKRERGAASLLKVRTSLPLGLKTAESVAVGNGSSEGPPKPLTESPLATSHIRVTHRRQTACVW